MLFLERNEKDMVETSKIKMRHICIFYHNYFKPYFVNLLSGQLINPLCINVSIYFSSFQYSVALLFPLKSSENLWFLMILGGIEVLQNTRKHCNK